MTKQYVKLYSWMTELGLSAAELIVYALVLAYTGFKGGFDGSAAWLSKWIGTSVRETAEVLESLCLKGLIYSCGRSGNAEIFKSTAIPGGAAPKKAAKPGNGNNTIDNNIDTIENNIDPIDKKNNNSIDDPIEHPIAYTKKAPARTNGPEPIGSIIGKMAGKKPSPLEAAKAAQAAQAAQKEAEEKERIKRQLESPRIKALIEEYGNLGLVPIEKLAATIKELDV